MPDILLDTNVISEIVRVMPDSRVLMWFENQPSTKLFLSSVTMGELHRGVARLATGKKKESLQKWIDHDLNAKFEGRLIAYDPECARLWGQIMGRGDNTGKPRPILDTQIAAIALKYGLVLATRNTTDFDGLGLKRINPWH